MCVNENEGKQRREGVRVGGGGGEEAGRVWRSWAL